MTRRRRVFAAVGAATAALVVAVTALIWVGEHPPMDTIEYRPPSQSDLRSFAETQVLFAHQSVGQNILDGIASIAAEEGVDVRVTAETDAVGAGGRVTHTFVGVNGDPLGKLAAFDDLVEAAAGSMEVALVKLCYVDITADSDPVALFEAYRSTMAELERRHPDTLFVYTTVPLTTDRSWKASVRALLGHDDQAGPADNVVRARYNALIREEYGETGRLFDIAAVEATVRDHPTDRTADAGPYQVLNGALAADNGHLNEDGARLAAAELIRVVAAARAGT